MIAEITKLLTAIEAKPQIKEVLNIQFIRNKPAFVRVVLQTKSDCQKIEASYDITGSCWVAGKKNPLFNIIIK